MTEVKVEIEKSPTKVVLDKELCATCDKMISCKNMSIHIKTDAHMKRLKSLASSIDKPDSNAPPKSDAGMFKIKQRFDDMDDKLNEIMERIDDILDLLDPEDELDTIDEEPKKK